MCRSTESGEHIKHWDRDRVFGITRILTAVASHLIERYCANVYSEIMYQALICRCPTVCVLVARIT